jgi:hypothetical protein
MRRIKLVLAALAVMAATLASVSSPALADDHLNCRDARGFLIRCDHQLFAPVNRFAFCDDFVFFNCARRFPFVTGFPFGLDIDQEIGPTGNVNIGLNVS